MNKLLLFNFIISFSFMGFSNEGQSAGKNRAEVSVTRHFDCTEFNSLYIRIRDGKISKKDAMNEMQKILPAIKQYYYSHGGKDAAASSWVFPVQGYTASAIGGKNGNGYIIGRYDFFDGNKHTGHPAHDIFIHDNNQDGLDDRTKKPVKILSVTSGIVVALEQEWSDTSNLKGGKYVCIYEPGSNSFFYYAHNSKVLVKLCDIVQPGDAIAEMGRTGIKAFKKRSPTHLHVMRLVLDKNGYPRPVNLYSDLLNMKTVKN